MSQIDAKLVKQLRDETGAKMMKCKEALEACGGDVEKAKDWLRKKNEGDAGKKAGRQTSEGLIQSYIHAGGKIGVMVEVLCETDFVARNEEFQQFVKDICLHIAASAPIAIKREDIPTDIIDKEREIYKEQITGKPENVVEKIVQGKVDKWYSERCLLEQPFVKDDKLTVGDMIKQKIAKIGENLVISRFARWELGEVSA